MVMCSCQFDADNAYSYLNRMYPEATKITRLTGDYNYLFVVTLPTGFRVVAFESALAVDNFYKIAYNWYIPNYIFDNRNNKHIMQNINTSPEIKEIPKQSKDMSKWLLDCLSRNDKSTCISAFDSIKE